jgi:hypothetical protein
MDERLRRLLGPAQPELTCEECFAELDWYVDRRLAGAGRPELCAPCRTPGACRQAGRCLGMQAHLEGCPACAEEYESLVALVRSDT